jgi:hypothetical protein
MGNESGDLAKSSDRRKRPPISTFYAYGMANSFKFRGVKLEAVDDIEIARFNPHY